MVFVYVLLLVINLLAFFLAFKTYISKYLFAGRVFFSSILIVCLLIVDLLSIWVIDSTGMFLPNQGVENNLQAHIDTSNQPIDPPVKIDDQAPAAHCKSQEALAKALTDLFDPTSKDKKTLSEQVLTCFQKSNQSILVKEKFAQSLADGSLFDITGQIRQVPIAEYLQYLIKMELGDQILIEIIKYDEQTGKVIYLEVVEMPKNQ